MNPDEWRAERGYNRNGQPVTRYVWQGVGQPPGSLATFDTTGGGTFIWSLDQPPWKLAGQEYSYSSAAPGSYVSGLTAPSVNPDDWVASPQLQADGSTRMVYVWQGQGNPPTGQAAVQEATVTDSAGRQSKRTVWVWSGAAAPWQQGEWARGRGGEGATPTAPGGIQDPGAAPSPPSDAPSPPRPLTPPAPARYPAFSGWQGVGIDGEDGMVRAGYVWDGDGAPPAGTATRRTVTINGQNRTAWVWSGPEAPVGATAPGQYPGQVQENALGDPNVPGARLVSLQDPRHGGRWTYYWAHGNMGDWRPDWAEKPQVQPSARWQFEPRGGRATGIPGNLANTLQYDPETNEWLPFEEWWQKFGRR